LGGAAITMDAVFNGARRDVDGVCVAVPKYTTCVVLYAALRRL
jgi:hypothetical protein